MIGQGLHYKMARPICERLIGPEAYEALDLDFLTDHITTFALAALGLAAPFDRAGKSAGEGGAVSLAGRRTG